MLNILVALRLWGYRWQGQRIVIKCANQAVVTILISGPTCEPTLAAITRNIAMISAVKDIELKAGKVNIIADNLSRLALGDIYKENLQHLIPSHTWIQSPNNILHLDWSS